MKKCKIRFFILCKETSKIEISYGRKRLFKTLAPAKRTIDFVLPYSRKITVTARTETQTQTVYYNLSPTPCQTLNIAFYPYQASYAPKMQSFTLSDKTYNLPVTCILNFNLC